MGFVFLSFCAQIRSHTALNIHSLSGDVPASVLTGDAVNISHLCEFESYKWIWYISPLGSDLMRKRSGRYCGPIYDVGEALCAWILTEKGLLLSRTSVIPLAAEEEENDSIQTKKTE